MKNEVHNIKKTIYLNRSLDEMIMKIAEENKCSFQKTMRYLIKNGIKNKQVVLKDYRRDYNNE